MKLQREFRHHRLRQKRGLELGLGLGLGLELGLPLLF
tara:strand:+ start:320 stop:430 length:111 start_codon:yes stop_codon:yes gene_type:complete